MNTVHCICSKGWLHGFKRDHGLPEHVKRAEKLELNAESCKKLTAKKAEMWVQNLNRTVSRKT
jgi:hypothetical protein